MVIIVAYLGSYSGFHACIVVRNKAVVDSKVIALCFAGGVELHA